MATRLNEAPAGGVTYQFANPHYEGDGYGKPEAVAEWPTWTQIMHEIPVCEHFCDICGGRLAFGKINPSELLHGVRQHEAGRHLPWIAQWAKGNINGCLPFCPKCGINWDVHDEICENRLKEPF